MTHPFPTRRDLSSLALATLGTLFTVLGSPSPQLEQPSAALSASEDPALDAYLDVDHAKREGAWFLDDAEVEARLSFAPEHDRLVWRVSASDRSVLLDAVTGEALEFTW